MNSTTEDYAIRYRREIPDSEFVLAAERSALISFESPDVTWLRISIRHDDEFVSYFSGELYRIESDNQLHKLGSDVPVATLPELAWESLSDRIGYRLSPAQMPESLSGPGFESVAHTIPISLRRGAAVPKSVSLRPIGIATSLDRLIQWANRASQRRLQQLRWTRFNGTAVVIGESLPPVEGTFFVRAGQILVPAGHWWEPTLPTPTVENVIQRHHAFRSEGELLWHPDDTITLLRTDDWATLNRGSLRMAHSAETLSGEELDGQVN